MPKFIYTILVITFGLWYLFTTYIYNVPPEGFFKIAGGIILFFITITFSFSLVIFYLNKKKSKNSKHYYDVELLKKLYRKSFKISLILALLFLVILVTKIFSVLK